MIMITLINKIISKCESNAGACHQVYINLLLLFRWGIMATFHFISKADIERKLDRLVSFCISIYESITYYGISTKLSFVSPITHYANVYLFSRIIKSILKEKMQTAKGFERRSSRTMFLTGFNFNFNCNVSPRRRECIQIKCKSRKCCAIVCARS